MTFARDFLQLSLFEWAVTCEHFTFRALLLRWPLILLFLLLRICHCWNRNRHTSVLVPPFPSAEAEAGAYTLLSEGLGIQYRTNGALIIMVIIMNIWLMSLSLGAISLKPCLIIDLQQ